MIHLIAAMTKNNVIGNDAKLIWHLPEDMKLFKQLTTNNTVIMGKTTWLSIPKKYRPLPNRKNIIISKTLQKAEGAEIAKSIEESIEIAKKYSGKIFCIGGAQIYKEFLGLVEYLHISHLKNEFEGNVFFPKINFDEWIEIEKIEFEDFTYKKYKRKNKLKTKL